MPLHQVRVPDNIWYAAKARARRNGEPVSAVIRRKLEEDLTEQDHREGEAERRKVARRRRQRGKKQAT